MDRATQSNPAKPDHPPLPLHAGCTPEEVPQVAVEVRRREHLDGGGLKWQLEDQAADSARDPGAMFRRGYPLPGGAETTFNADGGFQRKTIGQAVLEQAP